MGGGGEGVQDAVRPNAGTQESERVGGKKKKRMDKGRAGKTKKKQHKVAQPEKKVAVVVEEEEEEEEERGKDGGKDFNGNKLTRTHSIRFERWRTK